MSSLIPVNGLDRAIMAMQRSQAAMPEFFRELSKGELWFLVRYHPEIEGEWLQLKNGSPLPFAMLEDKQGAVVPLFSSEERLDEGLKRGHVPPRTYSAGAMPAVQILEILGKAELRAVVNKSCATGEITILPNLMRDLADGTALKPQPGGPPARARLQKLDPANYPTDLLQPVFEYMRGHRCFRAAWIMGFADTEPQPANGHGYHLLFLMDPRDAQVLHELNLIVQVACAKTDDVEIGQFDETDADYIAKIFREATPFYVAADYRPPQPRSPEP